jgi:hypothetical protein
LKAPPMGDLIVPGMLSKLMMRVTHSRAFTVAPVVYAALKTMEVNWDSIFHWQRDQQNFPAVNLSMRTFSDSSQTLLSPSLGPSAGHEWWSKGDGY